MENKGRLMDKYNKYLQKLNFATNEEQKRTYNLKLNEYKRKLADMNVDVNGNSNKATAQVNTSVVEAGVEAGINTGVNVNVKANPNSALKNARDVVNKSRELRSKMNLTGGSATAMRAFMEANGDNPALVKNVTDNLDNPINANSETIDQLFLTGGANESFDDALGKLNNLLNEFESIPKPSGNVADEIKNAKELQGQTVKDILKKVSEISVTDEAKTQKIKDLLSLIKSYEQQINDINDGTTGTNDRIEELEQMNQELIAESNELEEKLNEAKAENEEIKKTMDSINKENDTNAKEIIALGATINNLEENLANASDDSEISELQAQISELNKQIDVLEGMNKELIAESNDLEQQLRTDIAELEAELNSVDDKKSVNDAECEDLRKQLEEANDKINEIGSQLDEAINQLEEFKGKYKEALDDNALLSDNIASSVDTLKDIEEQVTKLREKQESDIKYGILGDTKFESNFIGGAVNEVVDTLSNLVGGSKSMESLLNTEDVNNLTIPKYNIDDL